MNALRRKTSTAVLVLLAVALMPAVARVAGTTSPMDDWVIEDLGIPAVDAAYDSHRDVVLAVVHAKTTLWATTSSRSTRGRGSWAGTSRLEAAPSRLP